MSVFSATAGALKLRPLAAIGLVLVPFLVGAILTWALASPTADLDRVTAAIVNNDTPVTVNGTTVPLGRQFAAGLIAGSTPSDDAASTATPTPSPTATSAPTASPSPTTPAGAIDLSASGPNFTWILTNDDEAAAGLSSGRYAAVVTIPSTFSAAATSFSGPAASARQAVIEVETTPASAFLDPALTQVVTAAATASLNQQLIAQYLGNVYAGFNTINEQIAQASDGASSLADGAASVSSGAQSLASGADQLASGIDTLDSGAQFLSRGLATLDAGVQSLPDDTAQLAQGSAEVSTAVGSLSSAISDATAQFAAVVARICQTPGDACDRATAALAKLQDADQQAGALADGAGQVASGNAALAEVIPALVDGLDLATRGAADLAAGADASNAGTATLDSGAENLASGAAQVDDGAAQLASGLAEAVEQIPTYSDDDIATLSSVVSQPVLADQDSIAPGVQSIPLFTVIALWFGGLALALALPAVPRRRLLTATPSPSIVAQAVAPTTTLGAAQGLVVAIAVLAGVRVGPVEWIAYASACILIGAFFALVNQALAAVLGGFGRVLAVVFGIVALAAGLSSTVPPALASIAGALPTASALHLLLAALTQDAGTGWAAVGVIVLIAVIAFALVLAGVIARRQVRGPATS